MSTVLSQSDGIVAHKKYRCDLCGETINKGDKYDRRTGCEDGMWTMHMHPECHAYESYETVDSDWYEDISEPAFERPLAPKQSSQ